MKKVLSIRERAGNMSVRISGFAFLLLPFVLAVSGCGGLRFAPGENQKQNAWLHNRTTLATAAAAEDENGSEKLQSLAKLSELQSRAFVADYGLPEELPKAQTAEEILSEQNWQLARSALNDSSQRPDAWDVADSALELAIGVCALFGGVYGTKAVRFLKNAKTQSQALKQVITGNELFKKQNPALSTAFKEAQQGQSAETKALVAEIKA